MGTRMAIYVRTATSRNAGVACDQQEQVCRTYALARGLSVTQVYTDQGMSGNSLDRPGLKALLAAVDAGNADAVVVADCNRLARNSKVLLNVIGLLERHNVVLAVAGEVAA